MLVRLFQGRHNGRGFGNTIMRKLLCPRGQRTDAGKIDTGAGCLEKIVRADVRWPRHLTCATLLHFAPEPAPGL